MIYMNYDEDPAQLLMPADQYERIVIGDRVVYLPIPGASAVTAALAVSGLSLAGKLLALKALTA